MPALDSAVSSPPLSSRSWGLVPAALLSGSAVLMFSLRLPLLGYVVVAVALACMCAPTRMIVEPSLVRSKPSAVPMRDALRLAGVTLAPPGQVESRAAVGGGTIEHEPVDIYVGYAPKGLEIAPNPDEVMDTAWVPLDELHRQTRDDAARFTPWLRIYLEEHSEQILADL